MCRSMVDIQSPTAEIRREKKRKKKEERRRNRMKIYMVSLLHRATIKISFTINSPYTRKQKNINARHWQWITTITIHFHWRLATNCLALLATDCVFPTWLVTGFTSIQTCSHLGMLIPWKSQSRDSSTNPGGTRLSLDLDHCYKAC